MWHTLWIRLFPFKTYNNNVPKILDSKNHAKTFTRNPAMRGATTHNNNLISTKQSKIKNQFISNKNIINRRRRRRRKYKREFSCQRNRTEMKKKKGTENEKVYMCIYKYIHWIYLWRWLGDRIQSSHRLNSLLLQAYKPRWDRFWANPFSGFRQKMKDHLSKLRGQGTTSYIVGNGTYIYLML